jgi:hypothetical protein
LGETELLQRRHAEYYLQLLERLSVQSFDLDIEARWFSMERANLYAICSWASSQGQSEILTRIGQALWELGMGAHLESGSAAGLDPLL